MKNEKKLPIVMIAGATASGKSKLALDVSEGRSIFIINGDSRQVYNELPTLTAFPSSDDLQQVPHLLYGVVSPTHKASAVWWKDQVMPLLDEAYAVGRTPVIVGGTGFYMRTLLKGISVIPSVDPVLLEKETQRLQNEGSAALWELLVKVDPILAGRLHPSDSHRILRGWTVWKETKIPLSQWHSRREGGLEKDPRFAFMKVFVNPEKHVLKERIASRVSLMEQAGMFEEVRAFLEKYQEEKTPLHKAIGVQEIEGYFLEKWTREEALSRIIHHTCLLAKRQVTWFKHQYDYDLTTQDTTIGLPSDLGLLRGICDFLKRWEAP